MANAGTAADATRRANNALGSRVTVGMCLHYVRTWCGAPGGYPTAIAGWRGAKYKHAGDKNPPAGVPVWYSGGSAGHVALSIGGGKIISTDWPHSGNVGKTTVTGLASSWHKTYLGWSEDIDNARIQKIGGAIANPDPSNPTENVPAANPVLGGFGLLANAAQWLLIVNWISDSHNWVRIGMFILGMILCIIALSRIAGVSMKTVSGAAQTVKKGFEYAKA